jgi:hypothetical protein
MPFWIYYLIWPLLAFGMQQPWLLVGVVLFVLLRNHIPDLGALWRAISRLSRLRRQVAINAADMTARRDLAMMYIDLRRPKAALDLVEEARARRPDDPELLYLRGLALHELGRHEDALEPLVRCIDLSAGLRYGMPYQVAGDALLALGRNEEAIDSYERYVSVNSSDIGAYVKLAQAHAQAGDRESARKAIAEGLATWRQVPGWMRRRSIGRWLGAQWARVWLLREPGAIGVAVAGAALAAVIASYTAPAVRGLVKRASRSSTPAEYPQVEAAGAVSPELLARCGTQSTGSFAGRYLEATVVPSALPSGVSVEDLVFEIKQDRVVMGQDELCLTRVVEEGPNHLSADALWRRVDDPSDAHVVGLHVARRGDAMRLSFWRNNDPMNAEWFDLRRLR